MHRINAINTSVRNLLPPKRICHHHRKLSDPIRINGTVASVMATPIAVLGSVTRSEERVSSTTIIALWLRLLFVLFSGIGFMCCLTLRFVENLERSGEFFRQQRFVMCVIFQYFLLVHKWQPSELEGIASLYVQLG